MRITAKKLRGAGACGDDIKAFEKRWPDGCNVTRKNCEIAFNELCMSANWAGNNLLSGSACAKFSKFVANTADACIKAKGGCECHKAFIEAFYQAAKG